MVKFTNCLFKMYNNIFGVDQPKNIYYKPWSEMHNNFAPFLTGNLCCPNDQLIGKTGMFNL